jgi:glycosyltransferase involved in cell wall biosynthesis
MKDSMKFSIIIPTYNRANFLLDTINSVLLQNYSYFEVIVVDDGSTDQTPFIMEQFTTNRIKYIRTENLERGSARNTGVRAATGDYVTFLDSDDKIYFNYFSNAAESLMKNNFPEFYHQEYEVKNEEGKLINYGHYYDAKEIEFLVKGNPLSCLGIFIKREVALAFPFVEDRNLSGSEDWELWLRLAANFGIIADKRVSSCLVIHNKRSVLNVNEEKLLLRKNLALVYAFKDNKVEQKFGKLKRKMEAYCDSYIALHLVISGENLKGLNYLLNSIKCFPAVIFERRSVAIFKIVILNLFRFSGK